MLSLSVFFSYTLQFYVVMEILGPNVLRPRVSEEWYPLTEFSIRDHPSMTSELKGEGVSPKEGAARLWQEKFVPGLQVI